MGVQCTRKELSDKVCPCGKRFNRKRMENGKLESVSDYERRQYCSRECGYKYNSGDGHWRKRLLYPR